MSCHAGLSATCAALVAMSTLSRSPAQAATWTAAPRGWVVPFYFLYTSHLYFSSPSSSYLLVTGPFRSCLRQCLVFDKYPKVPYKIVEFWDKEHISKFFLRECFIVIFIQLIPLPLDRPIPWRIEFSHKSFLCQAAFLQPIFRHQQSVWRIVFINKHVSPNIFPVPYPKTCKWCLTMFDNIVPCGNWKSVTISLCLLAIHLLKFICHQRFQVKNK